MKSLLVLMDVSPEPVSSGIGLILLLGIILFLAAAFAGGLVFLLIWLKRRKMKGAEMEMVLGRSTK
jgi:uncharacterized protein involved in exopolysaccharide biosynthesis